MPPQFGQREFLQTKLCLPCAQRKPVTCLVQQKVKLIILCWFNWNIFAVELCRWLKRDWPNTGAKSTGLREINARILISSKRREVWIWTTCKARSWSWLSVFQSQQSHFCLNWWFLNWKVYAIIKYANFDEIKISDFYLEISKFFHFKASLNDARLITTCIFIVHNIRLISFHLFRIKTRFFSASAVF